MVALQVGRKYKCKWNTRISQHEGHTKFVMELKSYDKQSGKGYVFPRNVGSLQYRHWTPTPRHRRYASSSNSHSTISQFRFVHLSAARVRFTLAQMSTQARAYACRDSPGQANQLIAPDESLWQSLSPCRQQEGFLSVWRILFLHSWTIYFWTSRTQRSSFSQHTTLQNLPGDPAWTGDVTALRRLVKHGPKRCTRILEMRAWRMVVFSNFNNLQSIDTAKICMESMVVLYIVRKPWTSATRRAPF